MESLFNIPEDFNCQSRSQVEESETKSGKGRSYAIKPKETKVRIEDRVAEKVKRSNQGQERRKQMLSERNKRKRKQQVGDLGSEAYEADLLTRESHGNTHLPRFTFSGIPLVAYNEPR